MEKKKLIQMATFGVPAYEMKAEETYRPPISLEHMRRLRALKRETGKPITELVADALEHYFEYSVDGEGNRGGGERDTRNYAEG